MASDVLWEELVQPGATWSHVLKRGTAIRITDMMGGANVGAMFYNADLPVERYNMPDTLKAQHIARLTTGSVLYSDMGRVLCSITNDTVGWHDPIGGHSNAAMVKSNYGEGNYQNRRNEYLKNARDGFIVELGKYGLGARDLVPNVNFFSKVQVGLDGRMEFVDGNSAPGSYIDLRAEMNILTILNTCQHPMDKGAKYDPKPVRLEIRRVPEPAADDPCRTFRPENERGFELTRRYFL